ncbi:MAG: T9SS type A sorting domain-containing protein [Ignavibacteriaceae bacterium]|nr:T9SS type A sorting domain-containing protein [Ignavibacteriaceae bacterium]
MRVFRKLISFYLFFVLFPAQGIFAGENTFQNNSFELDSNRPSFYPTDDSGLIFEKTFRYISKDSSYTDILQLKNLSGIAQAIQFRIQLNKAEDDSTILIFDNLEKGADISDQNWVVNYNIIKGTVLPNGASKDEVLILLYNLNQNGGLPPGDYNELLKVNYIVADLPVLQDSVKSSMKITNAQASTAQGQPIDITPSRDEFKLIIKAITIIPSQGLIFEKDTVYRLEYDSYVDIMQLKGLTDKAQALQFRLLVNQSIDDNVILTFQNIQKGSDILDPSWILTYNVFRGPLTGNGASVDEILVLLFNLDQNNGLPPGDYNELLKVKYRVADLPALQDSIKSSIKISEAEASTYQGFPIDITPSRDELTIIAQNRVSAYGDVNGDGCLDILDIIMIVDHIVGRDSLETDEFERANIAPWIPGEPAPNPDAYVNVQDLSLLQNIILTGVYPNGILINACSFTSIEKIYSGEDFKVTFYINKSGITLYSNASVDVRAVQVEFAGNIQISNNMFINTDLGHGYYNKDDEILRVLLYDRKAMKTIKSGENFIADIPSFISNPEDISIEKLILVDINRQRIMDAEIEIVYGTPPYIPLDYILYQNFPNPFNPSTSVRFEVPVDSKVMIKIYDILGREVKTLFNEQVPRGNYTIEWDGLNESGNQMSSGTYIYRMIANEFVQSKKMLLLK